MRRIPRSIRQRKLRMRARGFSIASESSQQRPPSWFAAIVDRRTDAMPMFDLWRADRCDTLTSSVPKAQSGGTFDCNSTSCVRRTMKCTGGRVAGSIVCLQVVRPSPVISNVTRLGSVYSPSPCSITVTHAPLQAVTRQNLLDWHHCDTLTP